jgi:hypothetical protein
MTERFPGFIFKLKQNTEEYMLYTAFCKVM